MQPEDVDGMRRSLAIGGTRSPVRCSYTSRSLPPDDATSRILLAFGEPLRETRAVVYPWKGAQP